MQSHMSTCSGPCPCPCMPCVSRRAKKHVHQYTVALVSCCACILLQVRRCAAEQLYLGLLGLDPDSEQAAMTAAKAAGHTDGPTAADLGSVCEPVCELLLATAWDGDIDAAKKARDEIALLIEVQVPKMKVPSSAAPKAVARDEFNSYQALLDDFARGY